MGVTGEVSCRVKVEYQYLFCNLRAWSLESFTLHLSLKFQYFRKQDNDKWKEVVMSNYRSWWAAGWLDQFVPILTNEWKHKQCHRSVDSVSKQAYSPLCKSYFFPMSILTTKWMRHLFCAPHQVFQTDCFSFQLLFSCANFEISILFFVWFLLAEVTHAYGSKWNNMYKRDN